MSQKNLNSRSRKRQPAASSLQLQIAAALVTHAEGRCGRGARFTWWVDGLRCTACQALVVAVPRVEEVLG